MPNVGPFSCELRVPAAQLLPFHIREQTKNSVLALVLYPSLHPLPLEICLRLTDYYEFDDGFAAYVFINGKHHTNGCWSGHGEGQGKGIFYGKEVAAMGRAATAGDWRLGPEGVTLLQTWPGSSKRKTKKVKESKKFKDKCIIEVIVLRTEKHGDYSVSEDEEEESNDDPDETDRGRRGQRKNSGRTVHRSRTGVFARLNLGYVHSANGRKVYTTKRRDFGSDGDSDVSIERSRGHQDCPEHEHNDSNLATSMSFFSSDNDDIDFTKQKKTVFDRKYARLRSQPPRGSSRRHKLYFDIPWSRGVSHPGFDVKKEDMNDSSGRCMQDDGTIASAVQDILGDRTVEAAGTHESMSSDWEEGVWPDKNLPRDIGIQQMDARAKHNFEEIIKDVDEVLNIDSNEAGKSMQEEEKSFASPAQSPISPYILSSSTASIELSRGSKNEKQDSSSDDESSSSSDSDAWSSSSSESDSDSSSSTSDSDSSNGKGKGKKKSKKSKKKKKPKRHPMFQKYWNMTEEGDRSRREIRRKQVTVLMSSQRITPKFIDTMEKPFAVFKFSFETPDNLQSEYSLDENQVKNITLRSKEEKKIKEALSRPDLLDLIDSLLKKASSTNGGGGSASDHDESSYGGMSPKEDRKARKKRKKGEKAAAKRQEQEDRKVEQESAREEAEQKKKDKEEERQNRKDQEKRDKEGAKKEKEDVNKNDTIGNNGWDDLNKDDSIKVDDNWGPKINDDTNPFDSAPTDAQKDKSTAMDDWGNDLATPAPAENKTSENTPAAETNEGGW